MMDRESWRGVEKDQTPEEQKLGVGLSLFVVYGEGWSVLGMNFYVQWVGSHG